jgi:hypothetical protein
MPEPKISPMPETKPTERDLYPRIDMRVPRALRGSLKALAKEHKAKSLGAYCKHVLIEHVRMKRAEKGLPVPRTISR